MRKITLISLALVTVLGSIASPSLAQVRGGGGSTAGGGNTGGGGSTGGGDSHREGRGEYLRIPPMKKKPVVFINAKGGAYCSTNLRVLFDESGHRTKVRHCDDRNHIEID